jgi:hypothetical protein
MYWVYSIVWPCVPHSHQQVARSGLVYVGNREPALDVVGVQGIQVARFVADVHESDGLRRGGLRVQFNELMVVDFEKGLGDAIPLFHGEELVEAELEVEGASGLQVGDAEGDVRDPGLVGRLRPAGRSAEKGKD